MLASSSGSSSNFIVPNGTFVVELVIFLVVLGVMAKFILPSLRRALDERGRMLADAQRASEAARGEAARLERERINVLASARAQARALLEGASQSVDGLIAEAREQGRAEHDRRFAEAADGLETERRRLHDDVMARAVELVAAAAERIVGGGFDADRHRRFITAELGGADEPTRAE
ncbi:MAG: HrpE/YscL family type III secretion apparatus protein [Acidimicrobiales bacterium]|jgi:F-type H+-transporting ATPase subunit b